MADGARFDIDIQATTLGVDSSAAQLNAFAARLQTIDSVATKFDTAVAAASKRLEEVSAVALSASTELGNAQLQYKGLEREADRAAKALEKANSEKKSSAEKLEKLRAQAASTAAAMQAQAIVVDKLAVVSKAATAEQTKLAGTLKTLEARQKSAADASKKTGDAVTWQGAQFKAMGKAGALAFAALAVGVVGALGAMGRFAVMSNPLAMMRLNIASQRLQFSLVKLFRGLDLSKFLGGMDRLGALFDTTNTSGRALKLLIETVMQPLFDAVGKLEPYVGEFFKGLIHGALQVYIAILKIEIAILKAMSPETRTAIKKFVASVLTLENAFTAGTAVVYAFAIVVGGVLLVALAATAIAAASLAAALSVIALIAVGVGVVVALLLAPFVAFGVGVAYVFAAITGKWTGFKKWIEGLATSAVKWGGDIIDGLINGITGKTKDLGAAMKGGVDAVQNAVKGGLKIHSPSLVMEQFGAHTSAGFAKGIEGGESDVGDAAAAMTGMVTIGATAGSSNTSSTSSRSIHIEHLTIGDSPVARQSFDDFKAMLLEAFEGASLSIGGGEVPA